MALPVVLLALLGGCAGNSYMGVSLKAGAADPALQALAMRARDGDKQAQLELGIAYEEGQGVPIDLSRAASLYRSAAGDDAGRLWVYTPAVGKVPAGVMPLPVANTPSPGLKEAQRRLARLDGVRRGSGQ